MQLRYFLIFVKVLLIHTEEETIFGSIDDFLGSRPQLDVPMFLVQKENRNIPYPNVMEGNSSYKPMTNGSNITTISSSTTKDPTARIVSFTKNIPITTSATVTTFPSITQEETSPPSIDQERSNSCIQQESSTPYIQQESFTPSIRLETSTPYLQQEKSTPFIRQDTSALSTTASIQKFKASSSTQKATTVSLAIPIVNPMTRNYTTEKINESIHKTTSLPPIFPPTTTSQKNDIESPNNQPPVNEFVNLFAKDEREDASPGMTIVNKMIFKHVPCLSNPMFTLANNRKCYYFVLRNIFTKDAIRHCQKFGGQIVRLRSRKDEFAVINLLISQKYTQRSTLLGGIECVDFNKCRFSFNKERININFVKSMFSLSQKMSNFPCTIMLNSKNGKWSCFDLESVTRSGLICEKTSP
uniref:C-type lectin domain-containing protein n=1 Tax=Rhabditophanes sp. KR3021 TaxID=114890 RepID=A0AC35TM73_9BILA